MAHLSVNVNKVATLRNARGKNLPDVVAEAQKIVRFGAQGITVHPRPDGRHIRWPDVFDLKKGIDVEFNIEGYPSDDFLHKVCEVVPEQCTLVPDPPEVLTSNAGWKVFGNEDFLRPCIDRLKQKDIRVSLFVDP
ncbi:MAG: pyridoxine 5'-phosphate synthase, partial [Pseudomonadota bacterium]